MKIGINLVGVSYNDGVGRYRNYQDSLDNFYTHIVNPLRNQGHEIEFFLYTYDNSKSFNVEESYQPNVCSFIEPDKNGLGGGDKLSNGLKVMADTYIKSLGQIMDIDTYHDCDVIISTRFDINFFRNPLDEFDYDFDKCTFLWKEPAYEHLPLANDTFIVLPRKMVSDLAMAIVTESSNPPEGISIGLHNIYRTMCDQVGKDNVTFALDEFVTGPENTLYKLERNE